MIRYLASIEIEDEDSCGHYSFDTREKAQEWCDRWNKQLTEEEKTEDNGRFLQQYLK